MILCDFSRNDMFLSLSLDVDPLDHPGNLTRTFPRDRDSRTSITSHTQPRELWGGVGSGGRGGEWREGWGERWWLSCGEGWVSGWG